MTTNPIPVGTYVTYDDEPNSLKVTGVVVEPTPEELAYAQTWEYPPTLGDVLVQWDNIDDEWDRSWHHHTDLRTLNQASDG